jgi:hypothetical protein
MFNGALNSYFLVRSPLIMHLRSPTMLKLEHCKSQAKSHMILLLTCARQARRRTDKTSTAHAIPQLNFQRASMAISTVTIASIGATSGTTTNNHNITLIPAESCALLIELNAVPVRLVGIVFLNNDVFWMIKCMAIVPLGIKNGRRYSVGKV